MKKRQLGKSSIEISELSLGCMSLPTIARREQGPLLKQQ